MSRIVKTSHAALPEHCIHGALALDQATDRTPQVAITSRIESMVDHTSSPPGAARAARPLCTGSLLLALAAWSGSARGSFLSGEALDSAADVLAWIVLIIVPVIGIVLFWIVHVLPEKIAHRKHHPQTQAIQTLCLLSLVFGGMLWPIAWLWAYTRPVAYKMAYGTERSDGYFFEEVERARAGKLSPAELDALASELETLHRRGTISPALDLIREEVVALRAPVGAPVAETQRRSA